MLIESLEGRAMLSVSPFDAAVIADRAKIAAELQKFQSDCSNATATILADANTLASADLKQSKTLAPLFKTLHSDVSAMLAQLKADNLAESAAVTKDESVVDAELQKITADKGNPKALKADYIVLRSDRIQLQNDEVAGLNARLATRQADYGKLFNDLSAIATAVSNDSGDTAQLKADVSKFLSDRTNVLNTLEGDLNALIADRMQLISDLNALQNQG